ncbi:MAG: Phosphotransferase enzyme [Alyxoria varia]|nr:MAG: Phosphotransferase enzyme [Alyxoria varia]
MTTNDEEKLFQYTSGRWIWGEEDQLRERYRRFDIAEIKRVAAESVGSRRCILLEKIGEGSFNKAYRLTMNDDKRVIVRIPTFGSGHPFYSTASEVATMEFASTVLGLPVPKVHAYSTTPENPTTCEYIIMEDAAGNPLDTRWDTLSPESKLSIMRDIVAAEARMSSITFSHYGSLYLTEQKVSNSVPATVTGNASPDVKQMIAQRFCIGPTANRDFWHGGREKLKIDRGPWSTALDCLRATPCCEKAWLQHFAGPIASTNLLPPCRSQAAPLEHIQLQMKLLAVLPALVDIDAGLLAPKLWHTDLYSRNIFIKDDRISSIIDWQGAYTGPFFLQAHPAGVINYTGPQMLKYPDNFDELDQSAKERIKSQASQSALLQLYIREVEKQNPDMAKVFELSHGKTRCNAINFAKDTWNGDVVAFRESLLNVERYWKDIAPTPSTCPIHFTEEDLKAHLDEAEGWNERADFFERVRGIIQPDGWTSHENYDHAMEIFQELKRLEVEDD